MDGTGLAYSVDWLIMDLGLGQGVGGTYADGKAACTAMGYDLAFPQSSSENEFYKNAVTEQSGENWWLGIENVAGFGWSLDSVDGNAAPPYTNWGTDQGSDDDVGGDYARGHVDFWEGNPYHGEWSDEPISANQDETSVVICTRPVGQ